MSEEEIEKMIEDLYKQRLAHKKHETTKSLKLDSWKGVGINLDFASLYPSTHRRHFTSKKSRRKRKIENIFN